MFSSKASEGHALLCLDIGTASVKACVFQETEEGEMQLKGTGFAEQQQGNIQGGSIIDLSRTIHNAQDAVRKAENQARIHPKDLVIGVSGELIKGMTVSLDYERTHPDKRITGQELKTIIYELQWQAFETIRQDIAEELGIPLVDLKLINASIVSVRVDREEVDDPRGMLGKTVTMDIFNCFSPLQHFGQLQSIAVELPFHDLRGVFIQSYAVCHSLLLRNALESAVVVDIGAGTTDFCVLVDGKIVGNRSFSLAGDSLTKRISHELSTSFQEAESIKMSYVSNELEKRSHKAVSEAIAADIDIWLSSFEFSLKELPLKKLPRKFLLCGKSSQMKEFKKTLKNHDWEHHFPIENSVRVRQLDYGDILDGDIDSNHFDPQFLPLIGVANTSFDLLFNNSSLDDILSVIIADK